MAVTLVGIPILGGSNSASTAVATVSGVTTGNYLAVIGEYEGSGRTMSVADDKGNTYSAASGAVYVNSFCTFACFIAPVTTGGTVAVTLTISGAAVARINMSVQEAVASSGGYDTSNSAYNASSATQVTGAVTPVQADALSLVAVTCASASSSWNGAYNSCKSAASNRFEAASRVLSSTASEEATATYGGAVSARAYIAVFKGAAAAGTPLPVLINLQRQYHN